MKTYDPVGTLLDIYENNILKIDSLLSLTSLFELEYNFLKFSSEFAWTSASFWTNRASKSSYLDTSNGHYGTKQQFIVELGLLALHSDERSSKGIFMM